MSLIVAAVRESAPGETRVALVPAAVGPLKALGLDVLVQAGAGFRAHISDDAYTAAGASVVPAGEIYRRADIVLCVAPPPDDTRMRRGQTIIGLLEPSQHPERIERWAADGVTAISLDRIPRTLSRAQTMDVLSSQASVVGYKAALEAANAYGGYLPMLTTAAGTVKPATVLVLGAGVAGLQAIATARRLGAIVTGYDVRPETRSEITSLGARFLDLGTAAIEASGAGGYARELTDAEREAQQAALDAKIAGFDIVITAAAVPGRRPPLLVSERALAAMRPGSVVVDTAAGLLGGNVALSKPDETVTVADDVTVIGAGNLAAHVPVAASTAYSRNLKAVLASLIHDGELAIDPEDEVHAAIVLTRPTKNVEGGEPR